MLKRLQKLTKNYSFFLFGARGTGKSTLIEVLFNKRDVLYINLLDPVEEDRFARNPNELIALVKGMSQDQKYVVIDEVQKLPKLLDVVHMLIESEKCGKFFVLTGSSARKLKAKGVNLLAGRAFVYHLFPFSYLELGEDFSLEQALNFGLLPGTFNFQSHQEKQAFLQSYTLTYMKEEIWAEQIIKNLDPFRKFLEVAAQCNGKIINYAKIARDVGVDEKTVKNYFLVLEDTLLGFILNSFEHSFRKRLKSAPKFYFFDVGVARSLARMLSIPVQAGTSYYGEVFEGFVINEILKLASYFKQEYKFSYLATGSGVEVDLVVDRPGDKLLLVEIKSNPNVLSENLSSLKSISGELEDAEVVCFSNDPRTKKLDHITVYPWKKGIQKYFT